MDEREVAESLAGIYGMLQQVRRNQFQIQKTASAMRLCLKQVPQFERSYLKYWDELSKQLDEPHAQAMGAIDELVRRLKRD